MRKIFNFVFLTAVLILIISSVITAADYGGKLNIRVFQKPLTLNPIYAVDQISELINAQIFENLVSYNSSGQLKSELAESWQIQKDAQTVIINLRNDVYFQEKIKNNQSQNKSRNVTADDWEWSLNYLADPENKSPYADILEDVEGYEDYRSGKSEQLEGITKLSKYTLEISLKRPNALFIYNLAHPAAAVMPKEDVENDNLTWSLNPVGTGAFYLKSYQGSRLKLKKNSSYWGYSGGNKLPYLEEITFYFTDQTAESIYNPKDFDLFKVDSEEYEMYKDEKLIPEGYRLIKIPESRLYYYGFDFSGAEENNFISQNRDLRELLNCLVDSEKIIDNLNLNNYIGQEKYIHSKSEDIYSRENEKCGELIKDLNNQSSLKLKLAVNNKDFNLLVAEEVKKQFSQFNIELEIEVLSWTKYLDNINSNNGNYDLFLQSSDIYNIFKYLRENFYSNGIDDKLNIYNYKNDRLNYLLDYLEIESSLEKRSRAYSLINNIIQSDIPALYLFQGAESYLINEDINNIEKFNNFYRKDQFKYMYFGE